MRTKMIAILIATFSLGFVQAQKTYEDLKAMDGFIQKVPFGQVKPVMNPEFIAADEAEIPDNAWVIGVVHNGKAKAYSMNLLVNFNVVNETDYALFWDPIGNVACAYENKVDGKTTNFLSSGGIYHGAMVFADTETRTFWAGLTGQGLAGVHEGKMLTRLPITHKTIFGDWKKRHPQTTVLTFQGKNHSDSNPLAGFVMAPQTIAPPVKTNKSLPPKTSVYTFYMNGKAHSIAHAAFMNGWKGKAGGSTVFFYRPEKSHPYYGSLGWNLGKDKLKKKGDVWQTKGKGTFNPIAGTFEDGSSAEPLNGVDTYWYVFSNYENKPKLLNPPRRRHSEFQKETAGRITAADDPTKIGRQ